MQGSGKVSKQAGYSSLILPLSQATRFNSRHSLFLGKGKQASHLASINSPIPSYGFPVTKKLIKVETSALFLRLLLSPNSQLPTPLTNQHITLITTGSIFGRMELTTDWPDQARPGQIHDLARQRPAPGAGAFKRSDYRLVVSDSYCMQMYALRSERRRKGSLEGGRCCRIVDCHVGR